MKKIALVFVVAVLLPSLVLAWLAVRSLRDQQFLLERQQSLLCQRVTDALAQNISDYLAQRQQEFSAQVESLVGDNDPRTVAAEFDDQLCRNWPLAEVGFCVTLSGKILSPAPNARPQTQMFRLDNSGFLGNHEPVEVYWNPARISGQNFNRAGPNQSFALNGPSSRGFGSSVGGGGGYDNFHHQTTTNVMALSRSVVNALTPDRDTVVRGGLASAGESGPPAAASAPPKLAYAEADGAVSADKIDSEQPMVASGSVAASESQVQTAYNFKAAQTRNVSPLSGNDGVLKVPSNDAKSNLSKVVPAEAEFSQLIGSESDGMLARFLQNKLKLMFWHRLNREPDLVFGAQLNLDRVVAGLRGLVQIEPALQNEICLALLDDNARPVVISRTGFQAAWKRPFVATEAGEGLPHWEVAAYLVNPAHLAQVAHTAKLTLGLLVMALVLAIGVGSWLIVRSLNSELKLARQKTDFVSNVSHELKTPLTSIRMFSELLAEERVSDPAKQRTYLNIITAETARLTRLINNVLDFSRMERGEKKYNFQACDLVEVVRAAGQTFRPHLEAGGFKFDCVLPATPVGVRGDADALSQVIVNLLSNAEKYSSGLKEISLELARRESPLPHAELRVLDRGPGVPRGSGEKIFEKFYRAHDSLSSGVQGSGLGLTIARQIARAHGGDVVYEPREGGGSCFILRLPLQST